MNYIHAITIICIVIAMFLIFREVVCWYWKLNQTTKTLSSIDNNLVYISAKLDEIALELHYK